MKSEGIVTTNLPVAEVLSRIRRYSDALDKTFVESRKRDLFSSKVVDKINWKSISASSATGTFSGAAGSLYKRCHIDLRQAGGPNRLSYSIYPPSWALPLFWAPMIICVFIPPMWIVLGIGIFYFFMFKNAGGRWIRKLLEEVEMSAST